VYQAPQPPTQQQQHVTFHQQQPPTLPNFGQGFVNYANPLMVGGFGNPPPPQYYTGGYVQGPMYAPLGGPQNQQTAQPTLPTGWGDPSLMAPPLRFTCSEPNRRHDEAMDVDDPAPTQRSRAHQGHARHSKRDEDRQPTQPTRQGGSSRPTQAKGKGKSRATEEELAEQELEENIGQLGELLRRLDGADVNPSLADFLEGDGVAQVVVGRLLDTIDNLQDELEKAKWAQWDTETCLIRATYKRPMSPHCNPVEDTGRQQKRKQVTNDGGVSTTQPPEVTNTPQEVRPCPQ
jgi:hypothetical protein